MPKASELRFLLGFGNWPTAGEFSCRGTLQNVWLASQTRCPNNSRMPTFRIMMAKTERGGPGLAASVFVGADGVIEDENRK